MIRAISEEIHCTISAEREERRAKKRRSRWGGDEKEKTFIPGMPTVLPTNLSKQQEEAYLGKAALFVLLIYYMLALKLVQGTLNFMYVCGIIQSIWSLFQ
jgi:hypothetical protein